VVPGLQVLRVPVDNGVDGRGSALGVRRTRGFASLTGIGDGVAEQAPATGDREGRTASRWWVRPALLGLVPVATVVVGGVLLWAAAAVAERAAVTLTEALPGLGLAIGAVSGGRLGGDFVNVSTSGVAGVAFGLPLLAGLLVARWLGARPTTSYLVGAAATGSAHAVLAIGFGLFPVHDPTSFSVVTVVWVPTSSLVVAVLSWGTAWLVNERSLRRTAWIGLAALTATGLGCALVVALREGLRGDLLPGTALAGGAFGPNLAAALVWLPRTEAGVLGGPQADAQHLLAFSAEHGRWALLVPAVAVGLLVLAASRARGLDGPGDAWRRLRDLALGVAVVVPLAAAAASPRFFEPDGTARWMGVPDAPGSLVEPALLLLVLLVVPQIVAAVTTDEAWPRELVGAVRQRLGALVGSRRRTDRQEWPVPTPQLWGSTGRGVGHGVAPPPTAHGAMPAAAPGVPAAAWPTAPPVGGHAHLGGSPHVGAQRPGWAQSPGGLQPPVHDPFEDDAAPPVSTAWSQVAPAATDPGGRAASSWPATAPAAPPSSPLAPAVSEDAWRHAPPPASPGAAEAPCAPGSGGGP
jgi:hypothetical protein